MATAPTDPQTQRLMRRNLRLLPWWWVLRWVWLGEGIWLIYLTQERGLTLGQALLFEAVLAAVVVGAELPMGMVADRFGRRTALILGSVCVVLAFFLFGTSAPFFVLLTSYALFGLADTNFSGADTAMLYDSLKATGRDEEFTSWHGRLNAVIAGAIAVFTVAGSVMVRWLPLWTPIIVSAFASAPALVLAWFMTEPPREGDRPSYLATGRQALAIVARSRAIVTVMLLMTVTTLSVTMMGVLQQQFLLDAGVPVWAIGLFVAGQMATAAAASWISEPLGRRLSLRRTFWVMPVGSAISIATAAAGSAWLYPAFIFPAVGWNVMFPHVTDYLARRAPDSVRATLISVNNLAAALAGLAFIPLAALGVDRAGFTPTVLAASAFLACCAALAYLSWLGTGDIERAPVDAPAAATVP